MAYLERELSFDRCGIDFGGVKDQNRVRGAKKRREAPLKRCCCWMVYNVVLSRGFPRVGFVN